MSRTGDVILLLGSLNDHLPPLGTALRSSSGLAANARKPCPDCGHSEQPGWRVDRWQRRLHPCWTCGGKQVAVNGKTRLTLAQAPVLQPGTLVADADWHGFTVRHIAGKGSVGYDPMDVLERPVQTTAQAAPPTKPSRMVGCDGCGGYPNQAGAGVRGKHLDDEGSERDTLCPVCSGSGWRSAARFVLDVDGRPAELTPMERRAEAGSYRELDAALAQLPGRWRKVVYDVHVNRLVDAGELCDVESFRLLAAMRVLELVMPATIKVPGGVRANAKTQREHAQALRGRRLAGEAGPAIAARDKEIRRLIRQGKPRQWVARYYGLSVSHVYRIAPVWETTAA